MERPTIDTPFQIAQEYTFIRGIESGPQKGAILAQRKRDQLKCAVWFFHYSQIEHWEYLDAAKRDLERLRHHPIDGLPRILDVLEFCDPPTPLLIYVEVFNDRGSTLEELSRSGQLSDPSDIAMAGVGICRILRKMHATLPPVIFNQLNARSVIKTPEGQYRLTRTGNLSRLFDGNQLVGSLRELSVQPPEGMLDESIPATDTYMLGTTLFWLITHDLFDPEVGLEGAKLTPGWAALLYDMLNPDVKTRLSDLDLIESRLRELAPAFNRHTPDLPAGDSLSRLPQIELENEHRSMEMARERLNESVTAKMARWQRKLLDLSLRNPLINLKPKTTNLVFLGLDPIDLTRAFAKGKKFKITGFEHTPQNDTPEAIQAICNENFAKNILTSDVAPDEYKRKLNKLYTTTQNNLRENGTNTLFVSLCSLVWRKKAGDKTTYHAPLLLVPVTLDRQTAQSQVTLTALDCDEYLFNTTLLEMLKQDFGLLIPDFNELSLDLTGCDDQRPPSLIDNLPRNENGIDLAVILQLIRHALREHPEFSLANDVMLGHFSFAKYLMWSDLVNSGPALSQNPVVNHLLYSARSPYLNEVEFVSPQTIDQTYAPSDLMLPFAADAAQTAAVATADRGKDFIIIGPPGTGKSQTIANLIAHLLGKNKRILFVSEKMAALEVVKRRLNAVGLGDFCLELHSNRANKCDFLQQLNHAMARADEIQKTVKTRSCDDLAQIRQKLNTTIDHMHRVWPNGLSLYQAMGVKMRHGKYASAFRFNWTNADIHTKTDFEQRIDCVESIQIDLGTLGKIKDHAHALIEETSWTPLWEQDLVEACTQTIQASDALQNAVSNFVQALALPQDDYSIAQIAAFERSYDALNEQRGFLAKYCGIKLGQTALDTVVESLQTYIACSGANALKDDQACSHALNQCLFPINEAFEQFIQAATQFRKTSESIRPNLDCPSLTLTDEECDAIQNALAQMREFEEAATLMADPDATVLAISNQLPQADAQNTGHIAHKTLTALNALNAEFAQKYTTFETTRAQLCQKLHLPELDETQRLNEVLAELVQTLAKCYQLEVGFSLGSNAKNTLAALKEVKTHLALFAQTMTQLSAEYPNDAWRRIHGATLANDWNNAVNAWWPKSVFAKKNIIKQMHANGCLGTPDPAKDASLLTILQKEAEAIEELAPALHIFSTWRGLQTPSQFADDIVESAERLSAVLLKLAEDPDALIQWRAALRPVLEDGNEFLAPDAAYGKLCRDYIQAHDALNDVKRRLIECIHNTAFVHTTSADQWSKARMRYNQAAQRLFAHDEPCLSQDADRAGRALNQACSHFKNCVQTVSDLAHRDIDAAFRPRNDGLVELKDAMNRIVSARTALRPWCAWKKHRKQALQLDLDPLITALDNDLVDRTHIVDAFYGAYCTWFATAAIQHDTLLSEFSSSVQDSLIQRFDEVDAQFRDYNVQKILSILAQNLAQNMADGDVAWGILKHEMEKQRRQKPIRQLFAECRDAITSIAPCMMMSPLSVAQYLPADASLFDVVIFDEASQITVWDAIGSLGRGQQIIVAGDPKQMPPTNFFARNLDDDVSEDEEEDADDLESILVELRGANIPEITLNIHYRSRCESLIAFSNYAYYGDKLTTFPAPVTDDHGVSVRYVDGIYDRGETGTNACEAEAVVQEILTRLTSPDPVVRNKSIGVVTFNSKQQALIEDKLDALREAHPEIEPFFTDAVPDPVFIKNLETVQGDERDVIIFSMTFGPDASGRVTMNFGPLNRVGGERRLNVALTRAKQELIVFSSLHPDQFGNVRARGVSDLRDFLRYAQNGVVALGKPPLTTEELSSGFELTVKEALEARGWRVQTHLGTSDFRIDLAILHPERDGEFLAGLLCDGKIYAEAPCARERELVRPQALQSLGWNILRLWSFDWWYDANAAADCLHKQLNGLLIRSK